MSSKFPPLVFLGFVALWWTVPYSITAHTYPIPTFFSEFAALSLFVLGAAALGWQWFALGRPRLNPSPRAAFIFLGLAAVLVAQRFLLPVQQPVLIYLGIGFLLVATLVMHVGYWSGRLGLAERTVLVSAYALLAGGAFALFCQLIQLFHLEVKVSPFVVAYRVADFRRPFANLAQANHLATYLAFALAAALYLVQTRRLPVWAWLVLTTLFAVGEALTVSRTPWLQVLVIVACGWLMAWSVSREIGARFRPRGLRLRPWLLPAGVLVIYLIVNVVVRELNVLLDWKLAVSAAERFKDAGQISPRLSLWRYGWTMFLGSPWLGVGWGDFPAAQHELVLSLGKVEIANNSHNIVVDLLAKTGGLGALVVFGGLAFWLWRAVSAGLSHARLFCFTLLGVVAVHACVEYPQQYLFFLLPVALLIGLLETESMVRVPARVSTALYGVLTVVGIGALYPVFADYQRAEVLYYGQRPEQQYRAAPSTFFSPWGNYGLATLLPLNADDLTGKLAMHRQAIALLPGETVLRRYAILLALDGRQQAAIEEVARLREFATALNDWPTQLGLMYALCDDQGVVLDGFKAELQRRYGGRPAASVNDDADGDEVDD
ncbi:PglL family O-oligosaccharyltransferase [Chitinasiproducens palmae]|uniref:O-antigen ligase n=1 Tax=Chitinasiproducens palmae TaxID=1770053 RepID=A0A1H2PW61_9BURK|nr:O-antigen ligase family protein [Chitinasiproducens palmae]SDV51577.1 O-antigen ligase [Chitinasiproducens palmae]